MSDVQGQSGTLSSDALITRAERESGAFGRADAGLRDRVVQLVDWINARGPYSIEQVLGMGDQILRLLSAHLSVALDRQRFPGIQEERIERPVFIVGFARSGTTVLHSLLAEDPDVLKPMSWHMYSPSPPPGAKPVVAGRIAYAHRQVEAWSDFCPAQKVFHPYVDKGAYQLIEDEELFALDLRNAYPFHFYKVPSLEPGMTLVADDHADAFRFHRSMLQHFQWNTGMSRWVCKGPSHQMNLAALFEVYPDALCIWAHRPIGEIYASNVAIRAATYDAIHGRPLDWSTQARAAVEALKTAVDRLIASDLINDPRIMHVGFKEVTRDPLEVIRRIYQRQDRELTATHAGRIVDWLADPENSSDRYGRYPYSYEAFGLDRDWVEALFSDYTERFGLW